MTSLLLSLVGLGLSTYLTIAHFKGAGILACSGHGLINCAVVTTSPEAAFLGMPVALLGLVSYVVMVAINTPWAWRATNYWLHLARFVLAIGSMAFVLWLVAAEVLIINHICLYCTGVHLVTFLLLITLVQVCPTQLGWTSSAA